MSNILWLAATAAVFFGWWICGSIGAEMNIRACERQHGMRCFNPDFHRSEAFLGPLLLAAMLMRRGGW